MRYTPCLYIQCQMIAAQPPNSAPCPLIKSPALCNLGHQSYRAGPQWPCATFKLAPVALTPQHLKSSGWTASKTLVTFDICAMKTTTMIMWRWDLWSARENSICWDGANEVSFYFLSLHTHTHTHTHNSAGTHTYIRYTYTNTHTYTTWANAHMFQTNTMRYL